MNETTELPVGWEKRFAENGRTYYADIINKTTTYNDPRITEEVDEILNTKKTKYNSSTTALEVLQGRNLSGKVAIVTGSNTGIGYETARALALHEVTVIMACRNVENTQNAIAAIKNEKPNAKLEAIQLDLSSLRSVEEFVKIFNKKHSLLHMLILNAGMVSSTYNRTVDNIEETFQVNHLSHFYLVKLLEPVLIRSLHSRVVAVSSEFHGLSYLNEKNMSKQQLSPTTSNGYSGFVAYNNSKFCNVLFSMELNRKLSSKGVYSNSVHPGKVYTNIAKKWWLAKLYFLLVMPFSKSPEQGAATTVFCATSPDHQYVGGKYFNNCCEFQPSTATKSQELATILWDLSEEMIKESLMQKSF